eukprot:scaffold1849_cov107-Isochrysis_galbana.AAC.4
MQDGLARDAARAVKVLSLISRSPMLFRHAKLLQAHRSTLQQHWAALTPHLPRLLDRIQLLRPHEAVFFEVHRSDRPTHANATAARVDQCEPHGGARQRGPPFVVRHPRRAVGS